VGCAVRAVAAEAQEMQQEFDLHELAIEDASHGHQRPKLEEYGNSLFAVLQTVELKGDDLQLGEIEIFVGRNYILSVRLHSERGFQNVRTRLRE
jgi:magnesium transporter